MPTYTTDDLTAFHIRRGQIEADNRKALKALYPNANDDTMKEVERRVAKLVRSSSKGQVPEDIAFVLLHNDGLVEAAYAELGQQLLQPSFMTTRPAAPVTKTKAHRGFFHRKHETEPAPTPAAAPAPTRSDPDDPTAELIRIGRSAGFVGSPDGVNYDEHHNHIRARELGAMLNDRGGMELMLAAHAKVLETSGPVRARELEACWGGVGQWMR